MRRTWDRLMLAVRILRGAMPLGRYVGLRYHEIPFPVAALTAWRLAGEERRGRGNVPRKGQ